MNDEFEYCWHTGNYEGQCCALCPYSSECSGSSVDEDDE